MYQESVKIKDGFEEDINTICYLGNSKHFQFINNSITEFDWSDGDIVFANSTCFNEDLMKEICYRAKFLKTNSLVITFTKSIQSELFQVVKKIRYKMSWGPATVYYHRKIPNVKTSEVSSKIFDAISNQF